MKYIKQFEINEYTAPKFKVGDYVRIHIRTEFYIITHVYHIPDTGYEYYIKALENDNLRRGLIEERKLTLVPEHEINAIKYNL